MEAFQFSTESEESTHSLVCRTEFCQNCYDQHSPKQGDLVLLYGGNSSKFKILKIGCQFIGVRGFTPHILNFSKSVNGEVIYSSACSICEVSYKPSKTPGCRDLVFSPQVKKVPIREWNFLITAKDLDYKVQGILV